MKIILNQGDRYILRFDRGEEVLGSLTEFCRTEQIEAASFTAIGACREAVVSFYNLHAKKYEEHEIRENLEIISLIGNVSLLDNKQLVHAHVTLGDSSLQVRGGHAKRLLVSATCEMSLQKFKGYVSRKFDEETGLNLMD